MSPTGGPLLSSWLSKKRQRNLFCIQENAEVVRIHAKTTDNVIHL